MTSARADEGSVRPRLDRTWLTPLCTDVGSHPGTGGSGSGETRLHRTVMNNQRLPRHSNPGVLRFRSCSHAFLCPVPGAGNTRVESEGLGVLVASRAWWRAG